MFQSPILIPHHFQRYYQIARAFLYAIVIASTIVFALRILFPTLFFSFNFRTPDSSSNTLLDPHATDNTPRTNGKIGKDGMLIATASVTGEFSQALISLTLEKKSTRPNTLNVSLRRSYRSFLLPTGRPITGFPAESLYKVDTVYYALRDGSLYPFVSDNAYLSRYPDSFAIPESKDFLADYPISENWIGYRVGSMVSFADGVFLIMSNTEMRPIGSADILLALGYRFEDVRPASEEEIGIYKRGRIFLLGAQHPDGTLLFDRDTNTYYLVENNSKRPLIDDNYREFISKRQAPIIVSSVASEERVSCILKPGFFGQTFSCQTPIVSLPSGVGNDFEITLGNNDTDIDINALQVSFETEKSKHNMLLILSQIKQRLLSRFGISQ
ncbi:MAG: hypothetical protein WAV46_03545 [Candidatus Moraniibacteriota bacterium]